MSERESGAVYADGCDVFVAPRMGLYGWDLGYKLASCDTAWDATAIAWRCRHFVPLLNAAEAMLHATSTEAAQAEAALRAIVRACREEGPTRG